MAQQSKLIRPFCVGLFVACCWVPAAFGEPPTSEDAVQSYRAQALELELGFYGSATVRRDGRDLEFAHFGGNAADVFGEGSEAYDAAQSYRAMRIAGFTLTMVGAGLLLAELVLILSGSDAVVDDTATGADGLKPLTFVLLGSGLGLSVVGIGLETSSLGYLSDAVHLHNAALAETKYGLTDRAQTPSRRFGLAARLSF